MNKSIPLFNTSSDLIPFAPPTEQGSSLPQVVTSKDSFDLSKFDHSYGQRPRETHAFTPIPDGRFRACITGLELGFAASSGNPLLKYGLRIDSGPFHNRALWKRTAITENTLRYVKRELLICGLTLQHLSQLPVRLHELLGTILEITKLTRGEHAEVFFNSRVGTAITETPKSRPLERVLIDPQVDLQRLNELYRSEPVLDQDPWAALPDARYAVVIERVELTKSRTSGNPVLKWTLRVAGGAYHNRLLWKRRAITENTLQFVKQDLAVCGLSLGKLSVLPESLHSLHGVELEVTKVSRGDDSNVFFNRRLGAPEEMEAEMKDDDIPF